MPIDILEKTVPIVKKEMREFDAEKLERLKALEISGKGRTGIIKAIDSRLITLRKGKTERFGFIPDTIFEPRTYEGLRDGDWLRFGLSGDVHMVNNYHDEDAWKHYCADLYREGITQLFLAGDLWDGCAGRTEIYPGHRMDVPTSNFERAMEWVARLCPDFQIKKDYITGNHDNKIYEREGVDAGRAMETRRKEFGHDDFRYLQPYYARIKLSENPPLFLDLVHLRRHVAYTAGYNLQTYIRKVPPSKRAHIYGMGHTHHRQYVPIEEETECFLVGGFQYPNSYSIRTGKGAARGGWIIGVKLNKRNSDPIERIKAEFLKYD